MLPELYLAYLPQPLPSLNGLCNFQGMDLFSNVVLLSHRSMNRYAWLREPQEINEHGLNFVGINFKNSVLSDKKNKNKYSNTFFSFSNLENTTLNYADLSWSNFTKANMKNCQLMNSDLSIANLVAADLTSANLRDAKMEGCNLSHANLTNADLTNAILTDVIFKNAILKGTKFISLPIYDKKNGVDAYFSQIRQVIKEYLSQLYVQLRSNDYFFELQIAIAHDVIHALSSVKQNLNPKDIVKIINDVKSHSMFKTLTTEATSNLQSSSIFSTSNNTNENNNFAKTPQSLFSDFSEELDDYIEYKKKKFKSRHDIKDWDMREQLALQINTQINELEDLPNTKEKTIAIKTLKKFKVGLLNYIDSPEKQINALTSNKSLISNNQILKDFLNTLKVSASSKTARKS